MAGRPTKLTKELLEKAGAYLQTNSSPSIGSLLPTIEGLALELNLTRETIYQWEEAGKEATVDSLKRQFSDIVGNLRSAQSEKLIQNSLAGRYNATISKLLLSKHGYVEKSEVDNNINGAVQFVNSVPRPKAGDASGTSS